MKTLTGTPRNPVQQILAILLAAGLAVLGLMFSAMVFAVLLVMGLLGWALLWWKMRAVRRQMQAHMQSPRRQARTRAGDVPSGHAEYAGHVIDGEAVRVDDGGR